MTRREVMAHLAKEYRDNPQGLGFDSKEALAQAVAKAGLDLDAL
jgi:hypothetical protein